MVTNYQMSLSSLLAVTDSNNGKTEPVEQWFENFDLEKVVTPVDADKLEQLLIETNYDPTETSFVVNGFRHGFDIEYRGPVN